MLNLINQIVARAKADRQRIVLPEGTEERTLKAANQILTDEVADLILLGKPAEINELAVKWGLGNISKATIIDPETSPKHEEYAQLLCELRKKKGMTIEEARQLTNDPLFYGCLMIKSGDADGQLAGARNTTGNVLRPALQIIKTAPGITCVSGAMLLLTHAPEYGKNGILVMGDVAVTPVPDPNQLAQIAVCTAQTAKAVAGIENPKVAMLSFSTKGSAKHEVVDKVVEATKIAKEMAPTLDLDGEMQADAALVPAPTTGGVTASFASLGDIMLAEPGALIGFAGPRVIEQTIGEKLPAGFQRSEFQMEHGFVDQVVPRSQLRDTLIQVLQLHAGGKHE